MISAFYASLIAIIFLALSAHVIVYRRSAHVSLGDGDDPHLRRRIRGQANCAEYAPIGLIMIVLMELQGAPWLLLHLVAISFVAGRFLHGYALSGTRQWVFGRVWGMLLTLISIGAAAIINLWMSLF